MMSPRTRLSDVAKEAGVSITTVARVLSGSGRNIRVSQERAAAIRAIAERLNYQPNINARALAGQSTRILGVLIDSEAPVTVFRALRWIEREANERGYRLMIGEGHNNLENLRDSYQMFCQHGVDGVIIMAHEYGDANADLSAYFRPDARTIFIGRPKLKDASYVLLDREAGIREAVRTLWERGRRRIGLVTDSAGFSSVRQRPNAYRETAAEYELEELIYRIPSSADAVQIRRQAVKLVDDFVLPARLDGLIAHNDSYAIALLSELHLAGLEVPRQLSLVGNDNDDICECLAPTLSSIDESSEIVARQAVRMLLDSIKDAERDYIARQVNVKTKLMVRNSI